MSDSQIKRAWARSNLEYFTRCLGYDNAQFHKDLYKLLQYDFGYGQKPIKQYLQLWPRGHGKTQCVSINYVLWLIGCNRDIHINIVSKTSSLAESILLSIITRIESDERYNSLFPNIKPGNPKKWTSKEIIVNRPTISKNPTVKATGLMGPITGGRSHIVICDDIIDEENIRTRLQLEKVDTWFWKVLYPTLYPDGAIWVIGTRWHYDDIYNKLLREWPHDVKQAIINEKQGTVLWHEYWSFQKLLQRRREIGDIFFNCQYQNEPSGMEGITLKSEWLRSWSRPPTGFKYAGVDPKGEGQDRFAIATSQYDPELRKLYLHDVWAENVSQYEGLLKLKQLHELHGYTKIFFESNALQKSLLNHPELKGLPTVPTLTDSNKERRFITMSSHFQSERAEINPLINHPRNEFYTEWVQFPKGRYDDALDGVEILTRNLLTSGETGVFVFGGGLRR